MINADEVVTIDELTTALRVFNDAAKLGMPISRGEADNVQELIFELRIRKAIREEILRIAEEMADEEEAAAAHADDERQRWLAGRIMNDPDASAFYTPHSGKGLFG
jgi:hypothetical protein